MEVNNPTKQMTQGLQPQVQAQQHGPKAQQSGTGQQPLVQQKSGIKQLDKAQPPSRRSPKGPQKSGERQVGGPPPTQQQAPARATVTFTGPGCTYATTPGHDHLQQLTPPSSPSGPGYLVRMPQSPPTLEELNNFDTERHPLTSTEQAAKLSNPGQSLPEADHDNGIVNPLSSGKAYKKADIGNRPDRVVAGLFKAPRHSSLAVAAAAATTGSPATGPKTPPLARPSTLRLTPNVHAHSAPVPWATSQTMLHINNSLRQAGHSDTVADKLTGASGLFAAHGVLQLTQSTCMEPVIQQGGAGNQQAGAVPFATGPEGPGEQAAVEHQGSPLSEKESDGLARSREEGELGKSHEEGKLRQALELSQRFLRALGKKEMYEASGRHGLSPHHDSPAPLEKEGLLEEAVEQVAAEIPEGQDGGGHRLRRY